MSEQQQFTFDEAKHECRLGGQVIPSVTQVLEAVGIIDYSYIPRETREMALERGSMVHRATEFDDAGDLDDETLDPILAPYVTANRRFRADVGFEPELIEHRDFHRVYKYAGTLDRRGVALKRKIIVDYKTNLAEEWVRMQLAAYAGFFPAPSEFVRWCVELHSDSTYRIIEYQPAAWRRDFNDFLCALRCYQLQGDYRRRRAESEGSR